LFNNYPAGDLSEKRPLFPGGAAFAFSVSGTVVNLSITGEKKQRETEYQSAQNYDVRCGMHFGIVPLIA
jgi:hypothetical protein